MSKGVKQLKFSKYLGLRILTWALTIWIGVTFIFFVPRMCPSDPVENMIGRIQSRSGQMDPVEMEALRKTLRVQFGLEGSLMEQYLSFLKKGLLQFDFGPSLMSFPTLWILSRLPSLYLRVDAGDNGDGLADWQFHRPTGRFANTGCL